MTTIDTRIDYLMNRYEAICNFLNTHDVTEATREEAREVLREMTTELVTLMKL